MNAALAAVLARPIAHRGLHDRQAGIIENSMSAAEAAARSGFGIECDIQLTQDGEAVVFHDETLERLTMRAGRVDTLSAAALGAIGLRDSVDAIPTLASFLTRLDGRVPLVIEIKSRFDGDVRLATRALAVVATYTGPVALKSFDPAVILHLRKLEARCPLGLVGPNKPTAASATIHDLEIYDFLSWHVGDLDQLDQASRRRPLMSWTIRTQDDERRAMAHAAQIIFEVFLPRFTEELLRSDRARPPSPRDMRQRQTFSTEIVPLHLPR